jgi:hypothetical protein
MNYILFIVLTLIGVLSVVYGVHLKRSAYFREDTRLGIRNRIDGSVFLCSGMSIIIVTGIYFAYDYGLHHQYNLSKI